MSGFPGPNRRAAATFRTGPVSVQRHVRRRKAGDDGWAKEISHGRCRGRCGHASTGCSGSAGVCGDGLTGQGCPDIPVTHTPPLKKYRRPAAHPVDSRLGSFRLSGRRLLRHHDAAGLVAASTGISGRRPCGVTGPRTRTILDKPIGMGYLGPTVSVTKDHPTVVKYRNELPTTHLFQFVIDAIRNG